MNISHSVISCTQGTSYITQQLVRLFPWRCTYYITPSKVAGTYSDEPTTDRLMRLLLQDTRSQRKAERFNFAVFSGGHLTHTNCFSFTYQGGLTPDPVKPVHRYFNVEPHLHTSAQIFEWQIISKPTELVVEYTL